MSSKLLSLDLDDIAAYNSHGEALVAAIKGADIAPIHHPVILGMFAVYTMLASTGYLDADDISWPPHSLKVFDPQSWLDVEVDPVVVSILALLPYPKLEHSRGGKWPLDPSALALSYLGPIEYEHSHLEQGKFHVAQRFFDGVGRDVIRADHTRLTSGGEYQGNNYIYDTNTGRLIILNYYEYLYGGIVKSDDKHYESYSGLSDRFLPAQDIMRNWIRNIHDLVYVPWFFEDREIRTVPFEFDPKDGSQLPPSRDRLSAYCNDPTWNEGLIYNVNRRRLDTNFVMALRNIYKTHGWPKHYNKEACLMALKAFGEEHERLWEPAFRLSRMYPEKYLPEPHPEEVVPRAEYMAFLERTAGGLAILKHKESRDEL